MFWATAETTEQFDLPRLRETARAGALAVSCQANLLMCRHGSWIISTRLSLFQLGLRGSQVLLVALRENAALLHGGQG